MTKTVQLNAIFFTIQYLSICHSLWHYILYHRKDLPIPFIWRDSFAVVLLLLLFLEADMKVTLGFSPRCTKSESGQFWFNAAQKGLYLCNGKEWISLIESKCCLKATELLALFGALENASWREALL